MNLASLITQKNIYDKTVVVKCIFNNKLKQRQHLDKVTGHETIKRQHYAEERAWSWLGIEAGLGKL